jgi:predicted tellurium resistance membrane protein TerC
VGMAKELWVMIAAVVISMIIMLIASKPIANFVNDNPSIKILALSFLVMIGMSLLAEGFQQHINKGYIYFAMAFSFTIEIINLRIDKKSAKRPK